MTNLSKSNLEQQISRIRMPQMDVHDRVMSEIQKLEQTSRQRKGWKRTLVLPLIFVMALVGTGFAYIHAIELFNASGERVLTIDSYDNSNAAGPLISEAEWKQYDSQLQPLETIIIYQPYDNPQKIVSSYTKPELIQDYQELRRRLGAQFGLPASLPDGYQFKEGSANVLVHVPHEWMEELRILGDESGRTATRTIQDKGLQGLQVDGVTLKMDVAGHDVVISVLEGQRFETLMTNREDHVRQSIVTINGVEGYVATVDGKQKLIWRSGNDASSLYYSLETTDVSEEGKQRLVELLGAFVGA